jgi:enoyl-CoA hydratase/carnithine racemase
LPKGDRVAYDTILVEQRGRWLRYTEPTKGAAMSLPIAMMTKESISRSYDTVLGEGIRFERRVFHAMFATADQKEGMRAFIRITDTRIRTQVKSRNKPFCRPLSIIT